MKKLFLSYFTIFFHPFKFHELYLKGEQEALSFVEIMTLSWLFKLIKTFYFFVGIHFLLWLVQSGKGRGAESSFQEKKYLFYWVLVSAIFFPLTLWFIGKFWSVLIRFFCVLYGKDEGANLNKHITVVSNAALISQGLLIVPVIGEFLVPFAFLFFLFAGLLKNLHFTVLQAVLVMISPLFLFLLMIVVSFGYVLLLFNMV